MKSLTISTLILLLCGSWAVAQQNYPSNQTSSPGSSGQTTTEGCLSRSDGGYTLTDKSGTTYKLSGDTSKLSDHIGHEIQVKGMIAESKTPGAASGTSAAGQPTLDVTSFKHISETCTSKSKSESEKPPMSEKPPR